MNQLDVLFMFGLGCLLAMMFFWWRARIWKGHCKVLIKAMKKDWTTAPVPAAESSIQSDARYERFCKMMRDGATFDQIREAFGPEIPYPMSPAWQEYGKDRKP
jgi:hypothetical protein